jgi:GYF domain 2
MSKEQWYIYRSGHRSGPISRQQIDQLKNTGKLAPTDSVWVDSFRDWRLASEVFGFESQTALPQLSVRRVNAKTKIFGVIVSIVALTSCIVAFSYLQNDSWKAPLPMKIDNLKDLPPGTHKTVKPPAEFAKIAPNSDPNSQFISFSAASLEGVQNGYWFYEVRAKVLKDVTIKKIIVNRNPTCNDNVPGEKREGQTIDFRTLCTGPGALPSPDVLTRYDTTTPIPSSGVDPGRVHLQKLFLAI